MIGKKYKNRLLSVGLVICFLFAIPLQANATATQKKNEAEKNLSETNSKIDALEGQAAQVDQELSEKGAELASILQAQAELEVDIQATEDSIAQAEADLAVAQETEAKQYSDMKLRIQFMYENGSGDSYWTAILSSKGIADMLNRIEYVKQVELADRDLLTEYENTVAEIEELKASLEAEHAQLLDLQAVYEAQESQVQAIITELEASAANYAKQIEEAQSLAASYKKKIEEANRQIEEEKKRAEEEARRKAAEAAAAANNNTNSSGNANTGSETKNYSGSSGVNPAQVTGVSGQDIVNYAMQYVGGPYVWGGGHKYTLADRQAYDITKGVDCSGFVSCVYAHFGIDTPTYSTSFAYGGQEVSADCMQPGDVIVYGTKGGIGHVAIYAGNGLIVEAQSTAAGITANRAWNNRQVIAIRRYY